MIMDSNVTTSFPEVVFWNNEEYKKAIGMLNVYVSKTGNVLFRDIDGKITQPKLHKWKTPNGYYIDVNAYTDRFERKSVLVHKLVCLTFNGPPPDNSVRYDINHINGIKSDNRSENLEWVTRSQNVQHAFDLGICIGGLRIEAVNVYTKEVKKYNSISSMSREFGIKRNKLRNMLARYRSKPNEAGWIFSVDDSSDKKLNRYQQMSVIFKDYVSINIYIVESVDRAAEMTGVTATTIRARLDPNMNKTNVDKLCSRYIFRKTDAVYTWPEFTQEEAMESEAQYLKRSKIR